MVPDPPWLAAEATAQEAGVLLARPEVRAVFVCDDEGLTGVVTRKTLVREVVAPGRHPRETPLGEIAEEPHYTIDSSETSTPPFVSSRSTTPNASRWSTVAGLSACSSRSVLQRRLAEDEGPSRDSD